MSLEVISDCASVSYGDPDNLLIMFSSSTAVHRGDFDFKDAAKNLPQTILFLRDDDLRTGYHNGVNGLSSSVDETVEFLRYFVKRMGPEQVTMFGASIGGYGALMHGFLLGVDKIITAGAVSFVDPAVRDSLDGRGERIPGAFEGVVEFYSTQGKEPKYLDTRPLAEKYGHRVKVAKLYYSPEDDVDSTQSCHVACHPHLQAIPRPGTSHRYISFQLVRDGSLAHDFETPAEELLRSQSDVAIV